MITEIIYRMHLKGDEIDTFFDVSEKICEAYILNRMITLEYPTDQNKTRIFRHIQKKITFRTVMIGDAVHRVVANHYFEERVKNV